MAICVLSGQGRPLSTDFVLGALTHQMQRRLPHLPGRGNNRLYLGNGSVFYVDCGSHPEIASAECRTPTDAVANLLAGLKLVAQMASRLPDVLDAGATPSIFRTNVDYAGRVSWGFHENYCGNRRVYNYIDWLTPHIVTRLVFTGSGGLDPFSPGIRYSLSPRVAFINAAVSGVATSGERAIFNTRDQSLANGYSRIHVIAGNLCCSENSLFLTIGTTALIVALAELAPHCALKIIDPIAAMRSCAHHPFKALRVQLKGIKTWMTAAGVQRYLLDTIENRLDHRWPEWAPAVCKAWRDALDDLESPSMSQSRFDWPLKHALFNREMQRHGLTQETVDAASDVLESISAASPPVDADVRNLDCSAIQIMRRNGILSRTAIKRAERMLAAHGLCWSHIDAVAALRTQLCRLDMQFGELLNGVHATLTQKSLIPDHRVVTDQMINHAMTEAPLGSRATLRAHWIKKLSRHHTPYQCDWDCIVGPDGHLNLSDPFACHAEFAPCARKPADGNGALEYLTWRMQALSAYLEGDYAAATRLLRQCMIVEFETESCHCHLARIAITQGPEHFSLAVKETSAAWAQRTAAPAYVVPRILWLRLALSYVLPPGVHGFGPPRLNLAYLKSALDVPRCEMEWTMDPVLAVLTPLVNAEQLALLTALVAACGDACYVPALDEHPAWHAARPRPVR